MPAPARPVVVSDILSFDTQPDRDEDLMLCTVNWQQQLQERSQKYYVFKATNVTAHDSEPTVPVFVQKSYYDERFGDKTGVVEFMITEADWQYGQRDDTGADRFVVLHDQTTQPFQHRFVASWLVQLANKGHAAACAGGYAEYADKIDSLGKKFLGDPLHPFTPPVVQSGDVLLVPSELSFWSFGSESKTIKWKQNWKDRSENYYCFETVNSTQSGKDVMLFIQKNWWDNDGNSEYHISKVATKNSNGQYELKIDSKSQYGQVDITGKGRFVVYHDKEHKPFQHRFVKSTLHNTVASAAQAQALAASFGIKPTGVDLSAILGSLEGVFGDYLHTFN